MLMTVDRRGSELQLFAFISLSYSAWQLWPLSVAHIRAMSSCCVHAAGNDGYSYAEDPLVRHLKLHASADFFCGVVPANVLAGLGKAMNLEGPAGVALRRLGREGLAWVPTAGNLCVLLAFAICLWLNMYMTGTMMQLAYIVQCT